MTDFSDITSLGYEINESLVAPPDIDQSGDEVPATPPDVQIYSISGPDFRSYVAEGDTALIAAYAESLPPADQPMAEAKPKTASRRKKT